MMKVVKRKKLIWCCQGAEECDGIRYNVDTGCFEFILYVNEGCNLVWHRIVACPICGSMTFDEGLNDD